MTDPAPPAGRFDGRAHLFALAVYFEDTDLSGAVYHANYLRFLERARSDMLAILGIDQRAAFEAGTGSYVVADLAIRYRAPARLGDVLVIESRLAALRSASARIHQRVRRGRVIVADADVTVAFVAPSGRPVRQPRAWLDAFRPLIEEEDADAR